MKLFALSLLSLLVVTSLFASCSRKSASQTQDTAIARQATPVNQALCEAHQAPRDACFICDASLRDPKRLWCKEHARYEDRCFICHPEAQDKARLYCSEHGLYEDECFLCHPEIKKTNG